MPEPNTQAHNENNTEKIINAYNENNIVLKAVAYNENNTVQMNSEEKSIWIDTGAQKCSTPVFLYSFKNIAMQRLYLRCNSFSLTQKPRMCKCISEDTNLFSPIRKTFGSYHYLSHHSKLNDLLTQEETAAGTSSIHYSLCLLFQKMHWSFIFIEKMSQESTYLYQKTDHLQLA